MRFFDRVLVPHMAESIRSLTRFINGEPGSVALVPNATHGLNSALQSLGRSLLSPGSEVLVLDTTYGSVKIMARELVAYTVFAPG